LFSSRYACVASSYLIEVSVVCGIPGNRGVQQGISLSFAVSSALWLRVAFLPERALFADVFGFARQLGFAHRWNRSRGAPSLPPPTSSIQPFSAPPLLDVVLRRLPEDRFGTARLTVGYDVGALIEHPLEPWKVSMLAGWSRAVVARLAGGFNARSRRTCYRVGCAVRLTRPVTLSRPPRF